VYNLISYKFLTQSFFMFLGYLCQGNNVKFSLLTKFLSENYSIVSSRWYCTGYLELIHLALLKLYSFTVCFSTSPWLLSSSTSLTILDMLSNYNLQFVLLWWTYFPCLHILLPSLSKHIWIVFLSWLLLIMMQGTHGNIDNCLRTWFQLF
jgi:hypothetical protein